MNSQSDEGDHELPKGVEGAWRGGSCPQCGDEVPANVVHCPTCRVLLNSELTEDSIEIPTFVPLKEIRAVQPAPVTGHYVVCPGCSQELRINRKYRGVKVSCKHCEHPFVYNEQIRVNAVYSSCPHCRKEIRARPNYLGMKVACRFCQGALQLTES